MPIHVHAPLTQSLAFKQWGGGWCAVRVVLTTVSSRAITCICGNEVKGWLTTKLTEKGGKSHTIAIATIELPGSQLTALTAGLLGIQAECH